MDATRLSDGLYVSLKVTKKSEHPHETDIGLYFMEDELVSDPKNHCVPFFKVLSVPDEDDKHIIVMPLLLNFIKLPFDTFGEVVECLRQLFEVGQLLRTCTSSHQPITGLVIYAQEPSCTSVRSQIFKLRDLTELMNSDCMWMNIMMDAKDLYVEPYHPVKPHMKRDFSGYTSHRTRTQHPPKYYFIDFGLSRQYDASEENPLEYPIFGGDKTVPEFQNNEDVPLNPFPTDVYYLGNVIRERFLNVSFHPRLSFELITVKTKVKTGFEFLKPLVDDMVQDDPNARPTMEQVVERFDSIRRNLSTWKLRSRVTDRDEGPFEHLYRGAAHWKRRVGFIVKRVSAVPRLSG
jgi:hypothetical protein